MKRKKQVASILSKKMSPRSKYQPHQGKQEKARRIKRKEDVHETDHGYWP